jgi:hypothetical protein
MQKTRSKVVRRMIGLGADSSNIDRVVNQETKIYNMPSSVSGLTKRTCRTKPKTEVDVGRTRTYAPEGN